jgi:hypothetical protein
VLDLLNTLRKDNTGCALHARLLARCRAAVPLRRLQAAHSPF